MTSILHIDIPLPLRTQAHHVHTLPRPRTKRVRVRHTANGFASMTSILHTGWSANLAASTDATTSFTFAGPGVYVHAGADGERMQCLCVCAR